VPLDLLDPQNRAVRLQVQDRVLHRREPGVVEDDPLRPAEGGHEAQGPGSAEDVGDCGQLAPEVQLLQDLHLGCALSGKLDVDL